MSTKAAISNVQTSGRCREQLDKGVGRGFAAEKVEMEQKEVRSDLDLSLSSTGVQLGACMGMWASGARTASLFTQKEPQQPSPEEQNVDTCRKESDTSKVSKLASTEHGKKGPLEEAVEQESLGSWQKVLLAAQAHCQKLCPRRRR